MNAKRAVLASRNAVGPETAGEPDLTVGRVDAELMAIRAELKASPDDGELTSKLHAIADAWLDRRSYLEFAAAAATLRRGQLASELAHHLAGVLP